jgi:type I restriction enzyme S subunit
MASAEPTAKPGWEVKTLGEVCEFQGGSQPPKSNFSPEPKDGYVRLIQIRDYKTDDKKVFVDKDLVRRFCTSEDVMIGRYGPPVFQILKGIEGAYNVALMKAIPNPNFLNREFTFHRLKAPDIQNYIVGLSERAAGQTGVNKAALHAFEILVPPLPEQERIVGILDEAFEGIAAATAQAEKNLHNARELFQSVLQSTFSQKGDDWVKTTLEKVCITFQYGTSSKSLSEGDIPVLRMGNLQEGRIIWDDLKYTSDKEEISKYLLIENDVLFNRTNSSEHVGKASIYDGSQPAIHAGYLIRLQVEPSSLDPKLLNYFLNCPSTREHGFSVMSKSVNQANINASKLKAYSIPLPPLPKQQAIVEKLDALSEETKALEAIYERKKAALSELKQSLLQKAFAGEL